MSKYGNKRTEVEGIVFASRREAQRYQELRLLEAVGRIKALRCQVKFALHVAGGKHVADYVSDFLYFDTDTNERVVEDVKGFRTPMYRLKRRWLFAEYGIEIVET